MKRISKCILSLILCGVLMLPSIGMLPKAEAEPESVQYLFCTQYPRGTGSNLWEFTQETLHFMNGWTATTVKNGFTLFALSSHSGQIAYCIEPNIEIFNSYEDKDTHIIHYNPNYEYNKDTFWSDYFAPNVDYISPEKARDYLGLILEYGYQGNLSTSWDVNNASDLDILMNAYATQILVWEVIVGERGNNFEHIKVDGLNSQTDRIKETCPGYDAFKKQYDIIVSKIKNLNGMTYPSFANIEKINAPQYEMHYQEDQFYITLENQNGNIDGTTFSATADGKPFNDISFQIEGNNLYIRSDCDFEGVVEVTMSTKMLAPDPAVISDGKYNPDVNSDDKGKQDMIFLSSDKQEVSFNCYFNLKFPHVHRYVPIYTDPDCIHHGYITWVCRCGNSFVNNYTDRLGHDFVPVNRVQPDCVTEGRIDYRCRRCGAEKIETLPPTGHTQPLWVTSKRASCTKDCEQQGLCTTCGKLLDSRAIPATGHGKLVWKVDFEATADHDGQMTQYCTVCGEAAGKSIPFPMHTHTEGYKDILRAPTCEDDGEQGVFCASCGACYDSEPLEKLGHSSETVSVTTTPNTCTTAGECTLYCTRCGLAVSTETLAPKGHGNGVWYTSVDASCTAAGEEILLCDHCGDKINVRTLAPLGHEGVWQTTIPASCTTTGEESLICLRCGTISETRSVPMTEHDDGVWTVSTRPTCTLDGEEICKCTACGQKIDARPIPAEGHDDGVWKIDFEATPDHDGQMSLYCSKCNQVLDTKAFSMHKHVSGYKQVIVAPTCTTQGEGVLCCSVCGAQYHMHSIAALGHLYSEWKMNNDGTHSRTCSRCHDVQTANCRFHDSVKEPTCTEGGYTQHVCLDCGYRFKDAITDPLGHDWTEWSAKKCNCGCKCGGYDCRCSGCKCDSAEHERFCKRCGVHEKEAHTWSEWTSDHNGSFFRNGTHSRVCTACGAQQTQEAKHTSYLGKIFYPIYLFLYNILNKTIYAVSLRWLFPGLNLPHV